LLDSQCLPDCVQDADDDQDGLGIRSLEYYQWDAARYCLSMLGSMVTCGLLLLVFRWVPVLALQCTHRRVHRAAATKVLVHSTDGQCTVVAIRATPAAMGGGGWRGGGREGRDTIPGGSDTILPRCFYFRSLRYFEREVQDSFAPMAYKAAQPYSSLLRASRLGMSLPEVHIRRSLFGENLAEVPVKSYLQLLLDEVLHPFYIFQVWSVIVWYLEPEAC